MEIIYKKPQTGRTTELIKRSAKDGGYIVVPNYSMACYVKRMAENMDLKIPFPLTADEILNRRYHAKGIRKIYIDKTEMFLKEVCRELEIGAIVLDDLSEWEEEKMQIKVKLDENAIMPTKAHGTDAGFDLYAPRDYTIKPLTDTGAGSVIIDTGVHMAIPKGYAGELKSKSGLNVKHGIISDGLIDAGYTGSIVAKLYNLSDTEYHIRKGDKITQIKIAPIIGAELIETDTLEETERGNGGFGSSGR